MSSLSLSISSSHNLWDYRTEIAKMEYGMGDVCVLAQNPRQSPSSPTLPWTNWPTASYEPLWKSPSWETAYIWKQQQCCLQCRKHLEMWAYCSLHSGQESMVLSCVLPPPGKRRTGPSPEWSTMLAVKDGLSECCLCCEQGEASLGEVAECLARVERARTFFPLACVPHLLPSLINSL